MTLRGFEGIEAISNLGAQVLEGRSQLRDLRAENADRTARSRYDRTNRPVLTTGPPSGRCGFGVLVTEVIGWPIETDVKGFWYVRVHGGLPRGRPQRPSVLVVCAGLVVERDLVPAASRRARLRTLRECHSK
jgi:hypothetical protein